MYYDFVSRHTHVTLWFLCELFCLLLGGFVSYFLSNRAVDNVKRTSNDPGSIKLLRNASRVVMLLGLVSGLFCTVMGLRDIHKATSSIVEPSIASVYTVHSVITLDDNKVDLTKDGSNERDICIIDVTHSTNQFRLEKCHLFSDATKSVSVPGTRK